MGELRLGRETFRTKGAAQARVSAVLYSSAGQLVGDDLELVLALLELHPSAAKKRGCGVAAIEVRDGLFGKPGFFIVRTDGTETDFSYLKCLRQKASTAEQDVRRAFRFAVDDQVLKFKCIAFHGDLPDLLCPLTGEPMTFTDAHVDHEPPQTFEALVRQFMCEQSLVASAVELGGRGDGELHPTIADESLEALWSAFHQQHAKLRVISRRANLEIVPRMVREQKREERR